MIEELIIMIVGVIWTLSFAYNLMVLHEVSMDEGIPDDIWHRLGIGIVAMLGGPILAIVIFLVNEQNKGNSD